MLLYWSEQLLSTFVFVSYIGEQATLQGRIRCILRVSEAQHMISYEIVQHF